MMLMKAMEARKKAEVSVYFLKNIIFDILGKGSREIRTLFR